MGGRVCYLHMGTGKTGSSAMQFALTRAHEELLSRGYLYPDASDNFRRVLAELPTAGNAGRISHALAEHGADDALDLIKRYCDDPRHLVLSCEGLSNLRSETLQAFHAGLKELGYEPNYLVFFRPQTENIVASYLQLTKSNKINVSLGEYLDQQFRSQQIKKHWDWYARAQKLEAVCGYDKLTVKWYPSIRRLGQNAIVTAAFDWLGITASDQPKTDIPIINPTPGWEALRILQVVNANGLALRKFGDKFLQQALRGELLGTPVRLDYVSSKRVHEATLAGNDRLLRRYCPTLVPELELVPPTELPEPVMDEETLKKLQSLAKKILIESGSPNERSRIDKLFAAGADRGYLRKRMPAIAKQVAAR